MMSADKKPATRHCSVCAGTDHNATRCPRAMRYHRKALAMLGEPMCIDCGETDRARFYSHPTSKTGCQSRCKPCDNAKRMGNYKRGNGGGVDAVRQPDGSIVLVRRTTQAKDGGR